MTTQNEPTTDTEPVSDTAATPATQDRPTPGPRPGPRPGPIAGQRPPVAVHHVDIGDPTEFGRIDDDGAVWLVAGGTERQIGSWQAGTPAEGLAHFSRKFADLATETEILEERLDARSGDPRKTQTAAQHLLEALPTAQVIGDVDTLTTRLQIIVERAGTQTGEVKAERDATRAAALARKTELAEEAERIGAEATQWKAGGNRLREILDEWRTIRGSDKKAEDALWRRYANARDAFNRRRGAHFAELDRQRAGVKTRKEELIAEAEALSSSTDWGATAAKYRDLMAQWKAAGRAPRDTDESLWTRFKAAQDVFFAARNAEQSERDAEFEENATAKLALLAEAEKTIDPARDLEGARRAFRTFRDRWEELGKVPRDQVQNLEGRVRALEKRLRAEEDADWSRTDPEALARAAQFAERAGKLTEQADRAAASGKDSEARALREQAAQWNEWADAAKNAVNDR